MIKPTKYKAIVAWHRMTGSYAYYVDALVRKAEEDDAPINAVYHDEVRGWVTTSDVKNRDMLNRIIVYLLNHT